MSSDTVEPRVGRVEFTGSRHELFGILARGYLLMLPTIGLYRFWQLTWKRRFYWQYTLIDGDPLEYTGNPIQLLTGFLFALAFFLPIYVALFYFSTQAGGIIVLGYLGLATVIWFLTGYAIYRARDFRLSRTLWRGVRFDQRGNAWAYALRRFGWSLLMLLSLGLVFPFMAGNLWRYRYINTWFGDRRFDFTGSWRLLLAPYYCVYVLNAVTIVGTITYTFANSAFIHLGNYALPNLTAAAMICGCVLVLAGSIGYFRVREASAMLSTVTIGAVALKVKVSARVLFGQYLAYGLSILAIILVLGLALVIVLGGVYASASAGGDADKAAAMLAMFQSGWLNTVGLILVYLLLLGLFAMLSEVILGFGWWALLARSTSLTNPDSLKTVKAANEDPSLIGEGLADALNVGAY